MSNWISAKDGQPETDGIYLCALDLHSVVGSDCKTIETLRYSLGCWLYDGKETNLVTHWQPLPGLPEGHPLPEERIKMKQDHNEIYRRAVDVFGVETELLQLCEEFSEMIKAVSKWWRNRETAKKNPSYRGDVIQELADIEIKCGQLRLILDITDIEIYEAKQRQLKKLSREIADELERQEPVIISADNEKGEPLTAAELRKYQDHALKSDERLKQISVYDRGALLIYENRMENIKRFTG